MGRPRDQEETTTPEAGDLALRLLKLYRRIGEYRIGRPPAAARAILASLAEEEHAIGRQPTPALAEARELALARIRETDAVPEPKVSHAALKAMQPRLQESHRAAQGSRRASA